MGASIFGPAPDEPCVASRRAGKAAQCAKPGKFRICAYNIFEGLDGYNAERVRLIKDWLRDQRLDVVGFNEANAFTSTKLSKIGDACDLPYSFLQKAPTGFHLGILSRHPFVVADTSGLRLHHGLLHAKVELDSEVLHVLITHLTPFEASARRQEAAAIVEYAIELSQGSIVLMGDLNSLSSSDRSQHQHDALCTSTLRNKKKLRRKFLDEDGDVDYEPIDMLYNAGFTDVCKVLNGLDSTTVPTSVNADDAHAARMRLDYILLGEELYDRARDACAVTIKDRMTDAISDHFPVILESSRWW